MNYLSFAGWLAFWGWIFSDTITRYLLPQLHSVYDVLEDLKSGKWLAVGIGSLLALIAQALIAVALTYFFMTWSTWCVLRCIVYTQNLETGRALYYITAFLCCECALGKVARADKYRTFFLSVFPYTMSMGAFVVFSMNPKPMQDAFPWLIRLMGLTF